MRKTVSKKQRIGIVCATLLLTAFVVLLSVPRSPIVSYAASEDISYDDTYVMDDLKGITIKNALGEKTYPDSAALYQDYGFASDKNMAIISFVEYCYSFYATKQANYALYFYVYNPQGVKINVTSASNAIFMRAPDNTAENFASYPIYCLSVCNEPNHEGLFYKFKIILSTEQREKLLRKLNSEDRTYSVGSINLSNATSGKVDNYATPNVYHFSGYTKGYGANENADSTLTSYNEESEILRLQVKSTFYRPPYVKSDDSEDKYTQATLHSVYFSVPNRVLRLYGELTAVHAQWKDALTKYALVIGNSGKSYGGRGDVDVNGEEAYNAIMQNLIGVKFDSTKTKYNDVLDVMYACGRVSPKSMFDAEYFSPVLQTKENCLVWRPLSANDPPTGDILYDWSFEAYDKYTTLVNPLYLCFYAGKGKDIVDTYTVSSSVIADYLATYSDTHTATVEGGERMYSSELFDYVAEEYTDMNIQKDETYSLMGGNEKASFKEYIKYCNKNNINMSNADSVELLREKMSNINAIQMVTDKDIVNVGDADISERLFIDKQDVADFKTYYSEAVNKDETVFLFRYRVTDYFARETGAFTIANIAKQPKLRDTNNYFFQMHVDLGFQVIDTTFTDGDVKRVIPVSMSPMDIIHSATPPLVTTKDKVRGLPWWVKLLLGIALFLLLCLFFPSLFPLLGKAIVWIVFLPVKLVAAIGKSIGDMTRKRRSAKAQERRDKKDGT